MKLALLTDQELRTLVKEAVRELLLEDEPAPGAPFTDEELARARVRLARKMGGTRR